MTKDELTKIVQSANKEVITAELLRYGFFDCKERTEYENIDLPDLFKGDFEVTEEFFDENNELRFHGLVFTDVDGYNGMEFIVINEGDEKNIFPIDTLIFAKQAN